MAFAVAVIVALVLVATALVVTVKLAEVAPDGTVTDAGTVAAALLLERVTTKPAVGAALVMVTVPVDETPPTTVVGLSDSAATVGAVMLRVAVLEDEL